MAYEPIIDGKQRRPDYRLRHAGEELFFEVKEFRQDPDQPLPQGAYDPYTAIREKINSARDKFREFNTTLLPTIANRLTEKQPIRFTSEQWRNYVPIRLPWTVCVRDGVPPGRVAVLLNRAHKHDLVLSINAAQSRLFTKSTEGELLVTDFRSSLLRSVFL